jgi:hypothetical protein
MDFTSAFGGVIVADSPTRASPTALPLRQDRLLAVQASGTLSLKVGLSATGVSGRDYLPIVEVLERRVCGMSNLASLAAEIRAARPAY